MARAVHAGLGVSKHANGRDTDYRQTLDEQRRTCPVIHGEDGSYTLLSHADVQAAALDAATFSSAVSAHRALPNSLDGAEHQAYRELIDKYMTPEAVALQEPQCHDHAQQIMQGFDAGQMVDAIADIGTPFAVRTQSTWLGWPKSVEGALVSWVADNQRAAGSGDRALHAEIAERFDGIIRGILDQHRSGPQDDVTWALMNDRVNGHPLDNTELVSILRNWTAGDLGSLAASIGVIVYALASDPGLQEELRWLQSQGRTLDFEDALEELLRIDDPFVSNRRVTTVDTVVSGVTITAGSRVHLNWTAANRDPEVFPDPNRFDPAANMDNNLVFGIGPHVCPGRGLTLMELRVMVWELLAETKWIHLAEYDFPQREQAPGNGWATVPVILER